MTPISLDRGTTLCIPLVFGAVQCL